jgi:WD40 repeat protein/serine/threonine protein kinase
MARPRDSGSGERDLSGRTIEHYRVIRRIGRGGMGEVYLARDMQLGRMVALKFIAAHRLGSVAVVKQFMHEARATARLSHPGIVTVYGVGEYDGNPYLVLEYLEGQTLRQRMREQSFTSTEIARIGLSIAEALAAAHEEGVLHRDLKPANVLLPHDGRIRVVDFGVARLVEQGEEFTGGPDAGEFASEDSRPAEPDESEDEPTRVDATEPEAPRLRGGTPGYMAPEQWNRQDEPASDVWALGVILYELVVGDRPYRAGSLRELRKRITAPEPVEFPHAFREIPTELTTLVRRCLAKSGAERPPAHEVAQVLEQLVLRGRTRLGEEANPFPGLLPFTERHADLFFGRDHEIAAFLERLRTEPVLPVVGSSGVGKSSFILAGVVPRLREQGNWHVVTLRPGSEPFSTLAERLTSSDTSMSGLYPSGTPRSQDSPASTEDSEPLDAGEIADELRHSPRRLAVWLQQLAERVHGRVLLFVDQLEELHTLVEDEATRHAFMEALCSASGDAREPVRVVFTLRDDFLGRVASAPIARETLGRLSLLRSPGATGLRETLLGPLRVVGYRFDDPQIAEDMVSAVQGEAASLPLLQFAMRMLWEGRDRRRKCLRRRTYDDMGGVGGALAEHADRVLDGLAPQEVEVAREMLLRLVTEDRTRRAMTAGQLLDGLPEGSRPVLDRLLEWRLLTVRRGQGSTGEGQIELAHESLIGTWGRLARWVEESREEFSALAEMTQAAELWEKRGRRRDELWEGEALQEARRRLERTTRHVPDSVRAFVQAGVEREGRHRRRRRGAWAAAIALLGLVAIGSLVVAWQLARSERQARAAERKAQQRRAEVLEESARAALARGHPLQAKARLRKALELRDSSLARSLWWRLSREPLLWRKERKAYLYDLALSPNGQTLAAASQTDLVYLLDTTTLSMRVLRGHEDQVLAVAFSPDGAQLASTSWDGEVRLWQLDSNRSRVVGRHDNAVLSVAFHPEGNTLATTGWDETVRLWKLPSGAPKQVLQHGARARVVRFSPDGSWLAAGGAGGLLHLWRAGSWGDRRTFDLEHGSVDALDFAPGSSNLAVGHGAGVIRVLEIPTGKERKLLAGHAGAVHSVQYSPQGQRLASAGFDWTARVWDLQSGQSVRTFQHGRKQLEDALFTPDGKALVTSDDRTMRAWALGKAHRSTPGHEDSVIGVAFSPNGAWLATAGNDHTIGVWDTETSQRRFLRGHDSGVRQVATGPKGRWLASASKDTTVRLWRMPAGRPVHELASHTGPVLGVDFGPEGRQLVTASSDRTLRLWDTESGQQKKVFRGHEHTARDVAFVPQSDALASCGSGGTVRVWDRKRGTSRVLGRHEGVARAIAVAPDGDHVVSAGLDGTLRLWNRHTGEERVVARSKARFYDVDFHPDGRRVVAAASDGTAPMWNLETNERTAFRGHRGEVNGVAFSRDGSRLATTSDDGTVRVWHTDRARSTWFSVGLVGSPPRTYGHHGWRAFGDNADRPPDGQRSLQWRESIEKRATDVSWSPRSVCIRTENGRIELWSPRRDVRLAVEQTHALTQLEATRAGCILLDRDGVHHLAPEGSRVLAPSASAVTTDEEGIVVASGRRVVTYDVQGRQLQSVPVSAGVRALARADEGLWVGYDGGIIERYPMRSRPDQSPLLLEDTPPKSVTLLLEGPKGTIIAGFANGFVGLWDAGTGHRLGRERLHGPVHDARLEGDRLYAVTGLGDQLVWDFSAFHAPYCEVMHRVWNEVPVVWEHGAAAHRPHPELHRCSSGQKTTRSGSDGGTGE